MKVTVACFGAMRDFLPPGSAGNEAALDLPAGASVADAVDALGVPRRLVFAVLVDGASAGMDHELGEGSAVTLMPPFSGG